MSDSTLPFDVEPNLAEARRFLRAVIGSSEQTCFQTFKSRPEIKIEPKWRFGSLAECSGWLTRENQRGAGVYFVVNYCDGAGRSASNVTRVRAVFVDLDGAPVEPLLECDAKPHVIIESSPGRYQGFWRCKNISTAEFTPMQKALIAKFNGDPACKDLGRVMRLPGFWHLKREPFMSRIHYYNQGLAYDRHFIRERLGLNIACTDERPVFATDSNNCDTPTVAKGNRHEEMKRLAVSFRKMGVTGKSLHETVMIQNSIRCKPPLHESEIAKITTWTNQRVKIASPGPNHAAADPAQCVVPATPPQIITWEELDQMEIPPVRWIIRDLLPEGLTVLAGAPKVGKSWLAQSLSLAVATGSEALGKFPATKGQVLHLALEDTKQRFQDRMRKLNKNGSKTGYRNASFCLQWDPLPNGLASLQKWILDQEIPRMIVIDTFQKIRSRNIGRFEDNVYAKDYVEVGLLHQLATRNNIAILLVHHKRKALSDDPFNGVSGSSGITGAADAIWIFDKPNRERMVASLMISGRDISDRKYALAWDSDHNMPGWNYVSPADDLQHSDDAERLIQTMLEANRPLSVSDITHASGVPQRQVYRILDKLRNSGLIRKATGLNGKYVLSDPQQSFSQSLNSRSSGYPENWDEI